MRKVKKDKRRETLKRWLRKCRKLNCCGICDNCKVSKFINIHANRVAKNEQIELEKVVGEFDLWQIEKLNTTP